MSEKIILIGSDGSWKATALLQALEDAGKSAEIITPDEAKERGLAITTEPITLTLEKAESNGLGKMYRSF